MENKSLIDIILNQYNAYKEAYESCLEEGSDKVLYRLEKLMAARKEKLATYKDEFMQIYPDQTIFLKKDDFASRAAEFKKHGMTLVSGFRFNIKKD